MQKKLIMMLFLLLYTGILQARAAVTYALNGGCFGDNLVAYCHAKWIAYKYDIPLLYRPFQYSDQLMMHELEMHLTQEELRKYSQYVDISQCQAYVIEPDKDILYIIPYFPESIIELTRPCFFFQFQVDWHNNSFKKILNTLIAPRFKFKVPEIPTGYISVALHVRLGAGFDVGNLEVFNTIFSVEPGSQLKFPSLKYYTRELKRLMSFYAEQKFYVHLFTDSSDPKELIDIFKQEIDNSNVIFDYRTTNRFDLNVLEDFFALAYYDCLIRPDSNFSIIASKLSTYKILISPWHHICVDNEYIIDEICINEVIQKVT